MSIDHHKEFLKMTSSASPSLEQKRDPDVENYYEKMKKWIFNQGNFILGKYLLFEGLKLRPFYLPHPLSFTDANYTCDYNAVLFSSKCKIIKL